MVTLNLKQLIVTQLEVVEVVISSWLLQYLWAELDYTTVRTKQHWCKDVFYERIDVNNIDVKNILWENWCKDLLSCHGKVTDVNQMN